MLLLLRVVVVVVVMVVLVLMLVLLVLELVLLLLLLLQVVVRRRRRAASTRWTKRVPACLTTTTTTEAHTRRGTHYRWRRTEGVGGRGVKVGRGGISSNGNTRGSEIGIRLGGSAPGLSPLRGVAVHCGGFT